MKTPWAAIASAFAYFSIFPHGSRHEAPTPAAIDALPLVGAVIGATAGAAGYGIASVTTPFVGYAAAFIVTIALSGAIHLDGFLDSCDALFASVDPQRRLEILKDPRHGTYAVAGMSMITVAWIAALSRYAPQQLPLVLAYAAVLARTSALLPMFLTRYARATPSSALAHMPSKIVFFMWFAIACIASFLINRWAWIAIPVVFCVNYAVARWVALRLGGGLAGDSYGFLITLTEPLALFLLLDIRV